MSAITLATALRRNAPEPPPGSVVLTEGPSGTAYQRFHSDGSWHSTASGLTRSFDWEALQRKTDRDGAFPLLLVHDADYCRVELPPA